MWTVEVIVMLAMIVSNSLFAAYEIALASVTLVRLQALANEQRRGAKAAVAMKAKIEASLAVIQLGVTLLGATAAATGGAAAKEVIEPYLLSLGISGGFAETAAIAMVVVPLTMVTIILGELLPKVFALRNKEWVCLQLSPVMQWISRSVWPVVWLLEKSVQWLVRLGERWWKGGSDAAASGREATFQELRALAALARTSRLIGSREEGIIVNAARLSSRPVGQIALGAEYISMLYAEDSIQESLLAAHHDMHTRFPVTERRGDPQGIIGYINFKDIVSCLRLSPDVAQLRAILRVLPSLQADTPIAACLERLIHEHTHIALLRDTTQRVVGLVTLEDILEELVGEIKDEFDHLPTHVTAAGDAWVVGGGATLAHFREITGFELPTDPTASPTTTLAEWVARRLNRPVRGGDLLDIGNLHLLVRKVRRSAVLEAHIRRGSGSEQDVLP